MKALERQVLTDLDIFVDAAIRLGESAPTAKPILANFIRVLKPAAAAIVFETLDAVIAHLDPPPPPATADRAELVVDEAAFLGDIKEAPPEPETAPIPPPVVEATPPTPPAKLIQYTPERIAVMRRDFAAGVHRNDLLATLNAMPGAPIKNVDMLSIKLAQLGIKRTGKPVVASSVPPVAAAPVRKESLPSAAVAKAPAVQAVVADTETIIRWGASRGLNQHKLELDKVNDRRLDLGLPPFAVEPRHGKARTA